MKGMPSINIYFILCVRTHSTKGFKIFIFDCDILKKTLSIGYIRKLFSIFAASLAGHT